MTKQSHYRINIALYAALFCSLSLALMDRFEPTRTDTPSAREATSTSPLTSDASPAPALIERPQQ